MSFEAYVALGLGITAGILLLALLVWKLPRRLRRTNFATRWKNLQQRLPDKEQWPQAIIEADDLLDEALRKKKFKGRSAGERLVSAQKVFTDNDSVWFGHKMRTKIEANPDMPLKKNDVQKALIGLRQGLKDLGAL